MKGALIICLLLTIVAAEAGYVAAGGVLDLALTDKPRLARKARLNIENLAKLKLGMVKDAMLKIMGKPRSSEVYKIKDIKIELISYLTETVKFEDHIA
jgi:outer membrane protein assembly factor BamE (lipoprotein component of BamABCDE complex)